MAVIQHKDIPDANLHEPKGAVSSANGNVYVSNGAGSGVWKRVGSDVLKGISGDGGLVGKKLISDGSNGFTLATDVAIGSMSITTNTNSFAITAAADTTLKTASQYQLFTGTGAPWMAGSTVGIPFSTDRLTAPVAGLYELSFWANVNAFPSAAAKLGFKYRISASTYAGRNPAVKANAVGDEAQLVGTDLVTLVANDYIQIYVASTVTGNMVLSDVNVILKLIKAA